MLNRNVANLTADPTKSAASISNSISSFLLKRANLTSSRSARTERKEVQINFEMLRTVHGTNRLLLEKFDFNSMGDSNQRTAQGT